MRDEGVVRFGHMNGKAFRWSAGSAGKQEQNGCQDYRRIANHIGSDDHLQFPLVTRMNAVYHDLLAMKVYRFSLSAVPVELSSWLFL